jgi:hypothetical protein
MATSIPFGSLIGLDSVSLTPTSITLYCLVAWIGVLCSAVLIGGKILANLRHQRRINKHVESHPLRRLFTRPKSVDHSSLLFGGLVTVLAAIWVLTLDEYLKIEALKWLRAFR